VEAARSPLENFKQMILGRVGASAPQTPGPTREAASNFFTSRDANAGARLIGDIGGGLSTGASAYRTIDTLQQQQKAAAAAL
jgi:hypothetical protein